MNARRLTHAALSLTVVLALAGGPAVAAVPGSAVVWTLGLPSPFAGTRFDGEYVADQGRIYFLGFRTTGDATDGSIWYADVSSRTAITYVDTGIDMPVPISNYQIAALTDADGRLGLYTFGGRDATPQAIDAVQVFYPDTNTTTVVDTDPWPGQSQSGCTTLPAMGVAVVDNMAYVIGGISFSELGCVDENSAETWIFDPLAPAGSRWAAGPDLNVARGYVTPAVLGGTIYAIGGDTNEFGSLFATQTVEAWAPPADGWDDAGVADLPVACDEAQAYGFESGPMADSVVLAGCGQWPNAVPDSYSYDSGANAWSYAGALNEGRRNHAGAFVVRGTSAIMFILGGYDVLIEPTTSSEFSQGGPLGWLGGVGERGVSRPGLAPSTS